MIELHDDALRLHVESVVVDMRDLFFMSSSCLKAVGSANRHWQARSLHALQAFSVDLVTLDIS